MDCGLVVCAESSKGTVRVKHIHSMQVSLRLLECLVAIHCFDVFMLAVFLLQTGIIDMLAQAMSEVMLFVKKNQ